LEQQVDTLFGIILPYANFAIFLALAIYFFRKPAAAAAEKTRDDFKKQSDEAAKARAEAQARLDELTRRRQALDKEIAELKSSSKQAADMEAAKIVSDAEKLATHLAAEARRVAEAEVGRARAALRQEIVDSVRAAVASKIKTDVKPDTHLTLVRKQIGELQSIKAEG